MLFIAFGLIMLFVAMTRPGSSRMFRGRYRSRVISNPPPRTRRPGDDPTSGLRDPSRPL